MKTYKQDTALMDLLKLTEVNRIICDTNMGTLKLRLRKGEKEYRFVLDSVELPKDLNKEVFELIYPVSPVLHSTLNPLDRTTYVPSIVFSDKPITAKDIPVLNVKNKGGRPKGSVNKIKNGK